MQSRKIDLRINTLTRVVNLVVQDKNFTFVPTLSLFHSPPPIICGYNTGQHMFVPACPSCVTLTIDIDTATTATTRSWSIRVTQYECGDLNAPEENCLQYLTAQTGAGKYYKTLTIVLLLKLNY